MMKLQAQMGRIALIVLLISWLMALRPCFAQIVAAPPSRTVSGVAQPDSEERLATTDELMRDDVLQRLISVDERGVSLLALLAKVTANPALSRETTLLCGRDCAEQKVQIRLMERPLAALMIDLTELLPGEWWRSPNHTYRLRMTKEARQRRELWWRLYNDERSRELKSLSAAILAQMRTPAEAPNSANPAPILPDEEKQRKTFWRGLPPQTQEKIANHIVENALYRSSGFLGSSGPIFEGGVVLPLEDVSEDVRTIALNSLKEMAKLTKGRVIAPPAYFSFINVGFCVIPRFILTDGEAWILGLDMSCGFGETLPAISVDHRRLPDVIKRREKNKQSVTESWRRLAAFQEAKVWKTEAEVPPPQEQTPPRRAEMLDWLGDKGKMEFVADFYSEPSRPLAVAEKKKSVTGSVPAELNLMAARNDVSWKRREDGVYLVRNNRWYRDDYLEVSAAELQSLKPLVTEFMTVGQAADALRRQSIREKGISPEAVKAAKRKKLQKQIALFCAITERLTIGQITNGLTFYVNETGSRAFDLDNPAYTWRPFGYFTEPLLGSYNTYRFLSALSPEQIETLTERTLPISGLSAMALDRLRLVHPEFSEIASEKEARRYGLILKSEPVAAVDFFYNSLAPPFTFPVYIYTQAVPLDK